MNNDKANLISERENDPPRFVLLIAGGLCIIASFWLFQWTQHHSLAGPFVNRISNPSQPSLIQNTAVLAERMADHNIAGSTVFLNPVEVVSVLGDYVFLIKLKDERLMPVVLLGEITGRQPEEQVTIRTGQKLQILGFLLPLADFRLITNPEFVDARTVENLSSKNFYISALRVVMLSP